jgi:hypothetical protein
MNAKRIPYEHARDGNRALWDEITPVHLRSYGVERLMCGMRKDRTIWTRPI